MLVKHGEELFPFRAYPCSPDWEEVYRCWRVIIAAGDRFMTPDEVMLLYD
jgi:hypothetical protein